MAARLVFSAAFLLVAASVAAAQLLPAPAVIWSLNRTAATPVYTDATFVVFLADDDTSSIAVYDVARRTFVVDRTDACFAHGGAVVPNLVNRVGDTVGFACRGSESPGEPSPLFTHVQLNVSSNTLSRVVPQGQNGTGWYLSIASPTTHAVCYAGPAVLWCVDISPVPRVRSFYVLDSATTTLLEYNGTIGVVGVADPTDSVGTTDLRLVDLRSNDGTASNDAVSWTFPGTGAYTIAGQGRYFVVFDTIGSPINGGRPERIVVIDLETRAMVARVIPDGVILADLPVTLEQSPGVAAWTVPRGGDATPRMMVALPLVGYSESFSGGTVRTFLSWIAVHAWAFDLLEAGASSTSHRRVARAFHTRVPFPFWSTDDTGAYTHISLTGVSGYLYVSVIQAAVSGPARSIGVVSVLRAADGAVLGNRTTPADQAPLVKSHGQTVGGFTVLSGCSEAGDEGVAVMVANTSTGQPLWTRGGTSVPRMGFSSRPPVDSSSNCLLTSNAAGVMCLHLPL